MGYTTNFRGEFRISPPLTEEHRAYLTAFAGSRRMLRDAALAGERPDPVREAVGLPVGPDGEFFVGDADNNFGQVHSEDVLEYNRSPVRQPGLWCRWVPNGDGTALVWDGSEKFYDYIPWLEYLVAYLLGPLGYRLNGEVIWFGDGTGDVGRITINDNKVTHTWGLE